MSELDSVGKRIEMVRLWVHESRRVYRDKLIDYKDMRQYDTIEKEMIKKFFNVCF